MRLTLLAATLFGALTAPAFAQNAAAPPPGYQSAPPSGYQGAPPSDYQGNPQGAPPHHAHSNKMRERFDAANVTHDGRLTRAQAEQAGLRMVSKNFDTIDTAHKGYVTFDEVKAYRRATAANHHHNNGQPPSNEVPGNQPPPA